MKLSISQFKIISCAILKQVLELIVTGYLLSHMIVGNPNPFEVFSVLIYNTNCCILADI